MLFRSLCYGVMSIDERLSAQVEIDQLRQALVLSQRQLARAKAKTDHLVDATIAAARDAVLAQPAAKIHVPKKDPRKKAAETALWHLTDWQGAKLTPSYNTEVMRQRVHRFVDKAMKITDIQRADHPVKDVVIAFGGDQIEGL